MHDHGHSVHTQGRTLHTYVRLLEISVEDGRTVKFVAIVYDLRMAAS
jgi:hypothetical protein